MDSGFYAAATAFVARSQALDTAANNLANAHATGFRAEREFFSGTLLGTAAAPSQAGNALNSYGMLGGSRVDLSQGEISSTGNPLDVAIQGPGFFRIQTAHGMRYTRDGAFTRATDGTLVTARGEAVLDTNGAPIRTLTAAISITADGTVSSGGGVVGRISVVAPNDASALTPEGANLYAAADGAMRESQVSQLRPGALESSNLNTISGTANLIAVQRSAEMMQRALQMFHNDMGKTAAEELSRV